MQVLRAVAMQPGPASLAAVARGAGLSPSVVHAHLVSLSRAGVIEQRAPNGHYDLGPFARQLGLSALERLDHYQTLHELALRLKEDTGHTIAVAVWGTAGPVLVQWLRGEMPLPLNVNIGSTIPVLGSAQGRVFLAYLPRRVTAKLVDREREMAAQKLGDEEIAELIASVLSAGFAYIADTLFSGMRAIAAPMFGSDGELVAAVSVVVSQFEPRIDERTTRKFLATTRAYSLKLSGNANGGG